MSFRTLSIVLSLATSLSLLTACGGQDRREKREKEREVAGAEPEGSTGGFLGGFGSPTPDADAPSPDAPSPGAPSPDAPSPDTPTPEGAAPDAPAPADSSLECSSENNCSFVEGTPTCFDGYIFAIESDADMSCRLPHRLESQKTWFACTDGPAEWVTLQNGVFAGFNAGSEEQVLSGAFRVASDFGLRFLPLVGNNFGDSFSADHVYWDGMSDSFSAPELGSCVLDSAVESIAGQWLWEDDSCTSGACRFTDNTFSTNASGLVNWHVREDISFQSFSDTLTWTRVGRARIDADGYVNLTFPAFDDDEPATQFTGYINADGDIYDEVREEWLIRQ